MFFNLLFLKPTTVFWVVVQGESLNDAMLITVVLLLFKLEDKNSLMRRLWSILRGANSEHSNSYIMRKLTDLFCLAILLAKFNMLASFTLYFLANIEGCTPTLFSNGASA